MQLRRPQIVSFWGSELKTWSFSSIIAFFLFVLTRRVRRLARLLPIILCRYYEDSNPSYPSDREYVLKQPPFSFRANALWLKQVWSFYLTNSCALYSTFMYDNLETKRVVFTYREQLILSVSVGALSRVLNFTGQ